VALQVLGKRGWLLVLVCRACPFVPYAPSNYIFGLSDVGALTFIVSSVRREKTRLCNEFSLCLSRACLGKMIIFSIKWRKKTPFHWCFAVPLSDRQKNLTCQDRLGTDRRKRWKNGVCAQVVAATPYTFLSGKKHPFWFSLFSVSSRIRTTYQDRLGTNVEVKLKKGGGGGVTQLPLVQPWTTLRSCRASRRLRGY
jgi:hypothetical protein